MAKKKGKPIQDERSYVKNLIASIIDRCPRRQPTSEDERRSQEMMAEEFKKLGLDTEFHSFQFNDNLYANIALHFGMSTAGTLVSGLFPALGLALHTTATGSYVAESTRKGYFLRRLLKFKPSQNLLATIPAKDEPKLRIVLISHADAAFTGFLFSDRMVKMSAKSTLPALKRSMALTTQTSGALMGFDSLRMLLGPLAIPLRPLEYLLTLPSLLAFLLNIEMVIRNEIVPGANDNLSGTAALPILAQRLIARKPEDVELVFAVSGCEEASLGGADALAREMESKWDKANTVILGLDGLTNGDLNYIHTEGEVIRTPVPKWLSDTIDDVAASEERFADEVKGFEVPVGGSDVAAFLAHGWDGVCLACVDPTIGAPRHYHQRSDTVENLDMDKLMYSIDFAEKLVDAIIERRLPTA